MEQRGTVMRGPLSQEASRTGAQSSASPSANPYAHNTLQWSLFNATASMLGLPGLVSSVDGLRDEGAGFHADGTTRRVGGGDTMSGAGGSASFDGRRASSYASAGMSGFGATGTGSGFTGYGMGRDQDWLYGNMFGDTVDEQGRVWGMGNQYSRLRHSGSGGGMGRDLFSGAGSGPGSGLFDSVLRRGLSAGMGFANSAVESSILGMMGGKDSPYGSGKVRLNFYLDVDGRSAARLQGEGDILWPLYDNPYTTIYTQIGLRSMYGGGEQYGPDRWIGNVGVGQRWFPGATVADDKSVDSGNWMFGYNAFYDHDLSRGHQRGGLGVEAQYDWLKVGSNWYLPLSNWKNSRDFDGAYVEERPAQGWDFRVKGYLPFYREVAVTGAYTQWYGEHVGMFGPSKLEKDPKIWSYGVEYTPVPALTAFVNQRQTERGRADTEFGLRFTYNFGMDAESQFKPSRVAEMRTVHGARHDFVDRENKIILEYRTKNTFRIDFLNFDGANTFSFRLRDGFDKAAVGQAVRVTAGGYVTVAEVAPQSPGLLARVRSALAGLFSVASAQADSGMSYMADANGIIRVRVDNPGKLDSLSLSAGETTTGFTRQSLGLGPKIVAEAKPDKKEVDAAETTGIRIKGAAYNAPVTWKVEGVALAPGGGVGAGVISGGRQTDAKGEAAGMFRATQAGGVRITATVGGEVTVCDLTVKGDTYAVTADPTNLTQLTPKEVTFTVKKNNSPVGSGTVVDVPTHAALGITGSTATTDANGQFKLTLTPTVSAATTETLSFTVGGKTVEAPFTVTPLSFSLASDKPSLTKGEEATLTLSSNLPSGTSVSWSIEGSSTATGTLSSPTSTVSGGKATVTLTATSLAAGNITVKAMAAGQSTTKDITVTATTYTLTADPNTLTQLAPKDVEFTVKKNGSAVGASIPVTFTADTTNFDNLPDTQQTTDGSGKFTVSDLKAKTAGTPSVSANVDGQTGVTVAFTVNPAPPASITIDTYSDNNAFSSGVSTASVTVLVKDAANTPLDGRTVTWSVESATNSSPAMASGWGSKKTGLAWGSTHSGVNSSTGGNDLTATTTSTTDSNGKATIQLSDIVGQRSVRIRATINNLTVDQVVTFANDGPLSKFKGEPFADTKKWANDFPLSSATSLPAAGLCGKSPSGFQSWPTPGDYSSETGLPTRAELRAVSASTGKGAAFSAGWPNSLYWTGELESSAGASYVDLFDGVAYYAVVGYSYHVVCRQ